MGSKVSGARAGYEYSRTYNRMRGVDFSSRGDSVNCRFAVLENMYRDYDSADSEAIESIPGFRRLHSGSQNFNGAFIQTASDGEKFVIIHENTTLYRLGLKNPSLLTRVDGMSAANNKNGHVFSFGGSFYFGDTVQLYRINDNGRGLAVMDGYDTAPYVPTVYLNDKEHEQRNLLTLRFYENHELTPAAKLFRGTLSLNYVVTDTKNKTCAVSGISGNDSKVFVPARVKLGGDWYTVTEIGGAAFANCKSLTEIRLSDTVEKIGIAAFSGCTSLKTVRGGDSLREIGSFCFSACVLSSLYLPAVFKKFGEDVFTDLSLHISYALDADAYANIENAPACVTVYGVQNKEISLGIIPESPTKQIHSVTIDGVSQTFSLETDASGFVKQILLDLPDKTALTGKMLSVLGHFDNNSAAVSLHGEDFTQRSKRSGRGVVETIRACKQVASIGGRLFAWGNPYYPSIVFYSKSAAVCSGGLYFGSLDYIEDGAEGREVISVIGLSDGISVFTASGREEESIFYHTPIDTDDTLLDRRYPVSEAHIGDAALCPAILFYDDPVFLSARGLYGIEKRELNLSRSVSPRSSLVNPMLMREDMRNASLAVWRGYLAISVGGRIYLADSRATFSGSRGKEYEWFFLDGIGTYTGDGRVYRYSANAPDGYSLSRTPDEVALGTVYSENRGSGLVHFVYSGDEKVAVYPTEEMTGGSFNPAKILLSTGDSLLFATENGDLCIFNTDKRGVAPDNIAAEEDFDADEYAAQMGQRIHPDFYDFAGHTPRYAVQTYFDDCELPTLSKDTVRGSLTVKIKTHGGSKIKCSVARDTDGFKAVGEFDGGRTDISRLTFASIPFASEERATVALPERERAWVEKSLALYSDSFRSPMGIYSISFRYRIRGKIRYT